MEEITKKKLQAIACKVRMGVIEGTYCAKSGHPGGSLSISDLLTYLYFAKMHIDPKQPEMADRDRLVLSKGHCAPALYATLAQRGFFPQEELQSLRHIGAMLQGHPCIHTPGIDSPVVRSDRAFPLPVVWLWLASWITLLIRFIPFWAMAKLKKVRSGKQRCLHRIIIWTTCWQS